jgi:hypothetical protein
MHATVRRNLRYIAMPEPSACADIYYSVSGFQSPKDQSTSTMRSTRASAAVTRLNAREPAHRYSMGITASGFFYLLRASGNGTPEKISTELTLDEFVAHVNGLGPQKAVKISKHDAAFEKQLGSKRGR